MITSSSYSEKGWGCSLQNKGTMGGGLSRRDPEVHVVVVQSQENGKMDAKLLRQTYTSIGKGGGRGENMRN